MYVAVTDIYIYIYIYFFFLQALLQLWVLIVLLSQSPEAH